MSEERHARGKDDRGRQPSRSQQRREAAQADPDPPKRAPGRKDPASCKGAHGAPHAPVIAVPGYARSLGLQCGWAVPWPPRRDDSPRWDCHHQEECANCGKVLRARVEPRECPAWHELTGAEREAVAARLAEIDARAEQFRARHAKPAVAGPQGYRRKRDDG